MSIHNLPNAQTAVKVPNLPTYDAEKLTGGRGLAHIVLDDKIYTLRITRQGKLILTK